MTSSVTSSSVTLTSSSVTTMDTLKGWVEDLAHKNGILENENKLLKLENQTLKDEMEQFTQGENPPSRKQRKIETEGTDENDLKIKIEDDDSSVTLALPTQSTVINPLVMEEIVRHLMRFMRPVDFLKCRLVCKLWKDEATHVLKDRLTMNLNIDANPSEHLQAFLDHISLSPKFPLFRGLILDLDYDNWRKDEKNVRKLFRIFGKSLHKLELTLFGGGWAMDDFRDVFLASLEQVKDLQLDLSCCLLHENQIYYPHHPKKILTNLTTFRIGLDGSSCPQENHGHTQVFTDLLRMAPNVRTLYWRSWEFEAYRPEQDGSTNFMESLVQISPPKLENLFIYSDISEAAFEYLKNSTLKLKELYLVNFQLFGVHLLAQPGRSEITPKHVRYGEGDHGILGTTLKINLENAIETYIFNVRNNSPEEEISCTKLLKVFESSLAAKLTEGQIVENG